MPARVIGYALGSGSVSLRLATPVASSKEPAAASAIQGQKPAGGTHAGASGKSQVPPTPTAERCAFA